MRTYKKKNIEFFKNFLLSSIIFLLVLFIHGDSQVYHRGDSRYVLHTSLSIIKHNNLQLDDYIDLINRDGYKDQTLNNKGHIINWYPYGTSLLIAPIVYSVEKTAYYYPPTGFDKQVVLNFIDEVDKVIASMIVAYTAVVIYLISRLYLNSFLSFVLSIIFAFATSAWSTASASLWQHGPSMFLLSMIILLILKAQKNSRLYPYIGLVASFAYVIRPSNIITLISISIYIFIKYKKYFLRYLIPALLVLSLFIYINLANYGMILPSYFQSTTHFMGLDRFKIEYFLAQIVSPNRGLLVFSPILFFSIYGIYLKLKSRTFQLLDFFLL